MAHTGHIFYSSTLNYSHLFVFIGSFKHLSCLPVHFDCKSSWRSTELTPNPTLLLPKCMEVYLAKLKLHPFFRRHPFKRKIVLQQLHLLGFLSTESSMDRSCTRCVTGHLRGSWCQQSLEVWKKISFGSTPGCQSPPGWHYMFNT